MKPADPVRTRHDEWMKRALSLWLKDLGDVQIDARIAGESRRGDVLFAERRGKGTPKQRRRLGALGDLARGRVPFEPFRSPPTQMELKGCVLKAVDLEAHEARSARRGKQPRSAVVGPTLCVIAPSLSRDYLAAAGASLVSPSKSGLYGLAPMWRTVLVAANELPADASTMWLRLLGRGKVQAEAASQLLALSEQDPLRDATMALLVAWQQDLPASAEQSEDEREMTMSLDQAYQRWERETLARGRSEGKAEAVLEVLGARGLPVTAAQRKRVLACADEKVLVGWLRAAATAPSVSALLDGTPAAPPRARRSGASARRPPTR